MNALDNPFARLGKLNNSFERLSDELEAAMPTGNSDQCYVTRVENERIHHALALCAADYERLEDSLNQFQAAILKQLLDELCKDHREKYTSVPVMEELIPRSPEAIRRCEQAGKETQ